MRHTSTKQADAKARLIRDKLREATAAKISPQAQAVLAILVAEAWPTTIEGQKHWTATMGWPLLVV